MGPDELTAWEHDWRSWASITPAVKSPSSDTAIITLRDPDNIQLELFFG